jgi:IstB-like ATP binding protein
MAERIASHLRSRRRGQAITQNEHRPKSHQAHLEWPPSRMVNWARSIGPNTAQLFERIMNEKPHPEMGYRSCLGIIRLAQQLARRLKAAKLRGPACVEDIDYRTARGLDKTVMRALAKDSTWVRNHENIFVLGPTDPVTFCCTSLTH